MANLNKVMLIGNCTRDPELKFTPKGTAVAEIGLAVNRVTTTDGGERREEVTFIDVTLWGRSAEIAGEYLKKGRPVFVEGRLQLDTWDDKQSGQKRSKLKVIGENIQLLGSREGGEALAKREEKEFGGNSERKVQSKPLPPRPPADPDLDVADDDRPF